jgi:drug/metabolite transporter (DMT)-like permease
MSGIDRGARLTPAPNGERSEASHLRGILLLLAAVCMYPLHDSIAKLLTADLAIMQVVWGKFIFQTVAVMAIVLPRAPRAVFRSRRLGLQLGRSLLLLLSMVLFVTAISFLPLADAVSILYVAPILVTALSVPLLGERVGRHRWTAVAIGFVGAMIIIRPGIGVTHWATALVLCAAVSSALFQIATRRLALSEPPLTTLL